MFHKSNLGSFGVGTGCDRFADRKGYLPESVEELLTMDYELDHTDLDPETGEWDKELREEFFAEASMSIREAQDNLSDWQEQDA